MPPPSGPHVASLVFSNLDDFREFFLALRDAEASLMTSQSARRMRVEAETRPVTSYTRQSTIECFQVRPGCVCTGCAISPGWLAQGGNAYCVPVRPVCGENHHETDEKFFARCKTETQ